MSFIVSKLCQNINIFTSLNRNLIEPISASSFQFRNYAARKGTRERKQKKRVKAAVVEKVGFIPHNQRNKEKLLALRPKRKFNDSWKRLPIDNVYPTKYYQWKTYSFEEAVNSHRETHHPDMYNLPNANLVVAIEMNMQGEKKTRFVEDFNRIVAIPHRFEHGEERAIIAFGKTIVSQKEALDAGAQLAGGAELIKQIQNGDVSLQNFQHVIAHPDILPELVSLRGLMKRKFPNPKNGSLDVDLNAMTIKFLHGINYVGKKDDYEKDFGLVETVIGTLNMDWRHLEANFEALINDLNSIRPKRAGDFITRCLLTSLPSSERFKIDHRLYVKEVKKAKKAEEEEEEEGERVAL